MGGTFRSGSRASTLDLDNSLLRSVATMALNRVLVVSKRVYNSSSNVCRSRNSCTFCRAASRAWRVPSLILARPASRTVCWRCCRSLASSIIRCRRSTLRSRSWTGGLPRGPLLGDRAGNGTRGVADLTARPTSAAEGTGLFMTASRYE